MKKKYNASVFIFTRDLRLDDNTCLLNSLRDSEKVIPIFVFTPEQIDKNKYRSDNCVQFMCESLVDLDKQLRKNGSRLFVFYGKTTDVINKFKTVINAVYITRDYSPFAKKRENDLKKLCNALDIEFVCEEGHCLLGTNAVKKADDTVYVKFTPYYNAAKKIKIEESAKNKYKNYVSSDKKFAWEYKKDFNEFYAENKKIFVRGGRDNAFKILLQISHFGEYNDTRDYPFKKTTGLSAYLKFGCISVKEVYWTFKKNLKSSNKLFTQLYWREFYMVILDKFPHVIGGPMKEDYNMDWDDDKKKFKKWCEGNTGIPIIDAGMRQMNTTGWMHNRVRMIVANFLVKILRINWLHGEKYFAQKLVDYDVANNNGGWQWSSSTGSDSQSYFRIFNPWRQSEKFDKDCMYIKKWIPKLQTVVNKDIHNWNLSYINYDVDYPKPIVDDLRVETNKTIKMYQKRYAV